MTNKIILVSKLLLLSLLVVGGVFIFRRLEGGEPSATVKDSKLPDVVESINDENDNSEAVTLVPNISEQADMIRVTSIKPNDKIPESIMVDGEAVGWWFSKDGEFTVRLTDSAGQNVGQFSALALQKIEAGKEDKMIPFRVSLVYEYPKTTTGFMVFERSGWEEILGGWKNMLVFPVSFR